MLLRYNDTSMKNNLKKALIGAVNEGTDEMLTQSNAIVPVKTGALKKSLRKDKIKDGFRVGGYTPYAVFVEMGTRRNKAKPYLRPALRAVNWLQLIKNWKNK